jgi:hypothetical protein
MINELDDIDNKLAGDLEMQLACRLLYDLAARS